MLVSLESLQTAGVYLPLGFSLLPPTWLQCLTPCVVVVVVVFVSFKPIALPKASVPLSVLTSTAGTCLNHQRPGIFSSSPDSTFESYSFPSWVSFRRNLYLSFSPCPYLWLLCPLGLMEIFGHGTQIPVIIPYKTGRTNLTLKDVFLLYSLRNCFTLFLLGAIDAFSHEKAGSPFFA